MQYADVQEHEYHERDDDNNNNQYDDVFDTTNNNYKDNIDYYYSSSITNYQQQNYQIYFDDECKDLADKSKKSVNYECVSNGGNTNCTPKTLTVTVFIV